MMRLWSSGGLYPRRRRMSNMLKKRKESGQALVEYALVLPLFLAALCATIDCAWIGYQYICFDYSYREASWELSVPNDNNPGEDYSLTGRDAAELIMANMEATALGIKRENLSIDAGDGEDTASINLWSVTKVDYYPGFYYDRHDVSKDYWYEKGENYWRYMRIKAKLTYEVYPPTPVGQVLFGNHLTYTKDLDKTRLKSISTP